MYRARYGVNLEKGPFERRTADFLWMMIFGALSLLVGDNVFIFIYLNIQISFKMICYAVEIID